MAVKTTDNKAFGAWDGTDRLVVDLSVSGFVQDSTVTIGFRLTNQGTTRESADLTVEAFPLISETSLDKNSALPGADSGIHVPQSGDFEPFRCDAGSTQAWHNGEHACCVLFVSS